jgi:hypothetical protein
MNYILSSSYKLRNPIVSAGVLVDIEPNLKLPRPILFMQPVQAEA